MRESGERERERERACVRVLEELAGTIWQSLTTRAVGARLCHVVLLRFHELSDVGTRSTGQHLRALRRGGSSDDLASAIEARVLVAAAEVLECERRRSPRREVLLCKHFGGIHARTVGSRQFFATDEPHARLKPLFLGRPE